MLPQSCDKNLSHIMIQLCNRFLQTMLQNLVNLTNQKRLNKELTHILYIVQIDDRNDIVFILCTSNKLIGNKLWIAVDNSVITNNY